ncbi:MAG: Gfo/Idh/MocA family oxidoreductase [Verrucomicrobiota bacterium]
MNQLRVVCVGAGYFAQFHYAAWKRLEQEFAVQLVCVVDQDLEKAKQLASSLDIDHWATDLSQLSELAFDLVDVITPPTTHVALVTQALEMGKDVICQKPFTENREQAQRLVDVAHEAGQKIVVHENFRFMPWYRKIAEMHSKGAIGEVLNISYRLRPGDGQGDQAYLDRQPYFQTMPRFLVHETAIHMIDVFRYLLGEMNSVSARLRKCNPAIAGEDSGLIVFEFESGAQGVFDGNRCLDHAASNRRRTMGEMWLEGTQGTIRLDGEARIWLRQFGENDEQLVDYAWQDNGFGGDCVYLLTRHVVSHFLENTELENQATDYLKNILIEESVYRSHEQRCVVSL